MKMNFQKRKKAKDSDNGLVVQKEIKVKDYFAISQAEEQLTKAEANLEIKKKQLAEFERKVQKAEEQLKDRKEKLKKAHGKKKTEVKKFVLMPLDF